MSIFETIMKWLTNIFKKKDKTIDNTPIVVNNINIDVDSKTNNTAITKEEFDTMYSEYNGKVILLDNGHARKTPGKRSPLFSDGSRFYEYEFSRDIVRRIAKELDRLNIKYHILVPEVDEDIALSTRANRANNYCNKYGRNNCVFISIHANAAGSGSEWMNARGWSVYTTKGVTASDSIATLFYKEAEKLLPKYGMTLRKDMSDGDPDYESNFTVIYKTLCPAILTENLFQDNMTDASFLMSDIGRDVIAQIHVNAIKKITGLS